MTGGKLKNRTVGCPLYALIKSPITAIVIFLLMVACSLSEFEPTPRYGVTAKILGTEKHIQPGENRDVVVEVTNTGTRTTNFEVRGRLQAPDEKEKSLPLRKIVLRAQGVGNVSWEYNFISSGEWTLNIDISSPDAKELEGETATTGILIVETCDGWDVYRVWKSGYPTIECTLLGLRMLWWGRIGKLGILVSAFAIMAEFAGPARMRAWGQSLHRVVSVRQLMGHLVPTYLWFIWTLVNWSAKILLFWLPASRPLRARFRDNSLRYLSNAGALGRWFRYSIVAMVVIFVGIIAIVTLISINDPIFLLLLVILVYFMFILGWSMILLAPLAFVIALSGVNALILEPFAWLMERGERGVKIASFGLFLLAFHFDLLAS